MLKQSDVLDTMFHALADPTRRHMVDRLSRGPASVSELAAPFAMSMPAVMQHIAVLEAGGIIRTKKTGRVRSCELHESALTEAEAWIHDRRRVWEQRLDRLGALLEAEMFKEEKND
jgi:DNA-binding transcriptional ArsR family regulator